MYFYDSDGNFLEEKDFQQELILSGYSSSGSMCRFTDVLYIMDWSGKLFKFYFISELLNEA